jgi:hypothetical protein
MLSRFRLFFGTLAVGVFCFATPGLTFAQQARPTAPLDDPAALPDAPGEQVDALALALFAEQQATPQQTATPPQDSSSAQTPASPQQTTSTQTPAGAEKSDREKAEDQLRAQEHQRVAGVMATFNTTTNREALPLSPGQKFRLFFRSSTDPWPFLLAGVVSGIGQANDSYREWGQGTQGYAKRYGAAYSDAFIGNFFGNAVLPVLLHEDPRYFQMGTGNRAKRLLWAAASTFWCRRDNGKWGPNYANVGGNMIGAAIARAYYPPSERDVPSTLSDGITVSVEGIVGAEVIEFWPDFARHIKRKHDEKLARQAAQKTASR